LFRSLLAGVPLGERDPDPDPVLLAGHDLGLEVAAE
jgi:hypothetical protein